MTGKEPSLIRSKLRRPFIRTDLVARPRLQNQIAQGLQGPLTLITAPAGFGKTTLAASCVDSCSMPTAWLSLDKHDNQISRFLLYLIAALQTVEPAIGKEALQLLTEAQQITPEAVMTGLINDLEATGKEIVLVLDDYHLINSPVLHEALIFLLEHCPGTLHLLIATRSDPPLPLARLRARAQTVELRASDLRFTSAEAAQFLNDVMGLHLNEDAIEALEKRTEGWIAGLQMAALSMRDRRDIDTFIREFAGTNRFIMDFMLEEVLAREPQAVQDFLLQTAILTRLSGPLCDALTGSHNGSQMLEKLEKDNLFVVPLDEERQWYRYHHLFADLLQARLLQSGQAQVARLYKNAAAWCEKAGETSDAIDYAFAARDYEHAASLVARTWYTRSNNGEIETVQSWLEALPQEVISKNALLGTAYCWMLWFTGRVISMEPYLLNAERALKETDLSQVPEEEKADYALLPAELAALRSFVVRYRSAPETAITLAEGALELIPAEVSPQMDAQLRAIIYVALATAYDGAGDLEKAVSAYYESVRLSQHINNASGMAITYRLAGALRLLGRLHEARTACHDALMYMQTQGMAHFPAAGILHMAMSEVLVEQNDLIAAQHHLSQAYELGKYSGRLDAVRNAAYTRSRLGLARHDMDGALTAVEEAEASLGAMPSPLAKSEILAIKARMLTHQGVLSKAAHCAEEATRLAGSDQGQTAEMAALAMARVICARSGEEETLSHLSQHINKAEQQGRQGATLELRIQRSLLLTQQDKTNEARADLQHALSIAEAGGYLRIFLDEGQPMQILIKQWLAQAAVGPLRDYAARLLDQFDIEFGKDKTETVPSADGLIEPLSPREMEVLELMASGMTNKQIAAQLIVSPGTVKAHTAAIYRKLNAANRTESVARARQLGLLT